MVAARWLLLLLVILRGFGEHHLIEIRVDEGEVLAAAVSSERVLVGASDLLEELGSGALEHSGAEEVGISSQ